MESGRGDVTARSAASRQSQREAVTYNVKASIRQIETWQFVKRSYLSLLWWVPGKPRSCLLLSRSASLTPRVRFRYICFVLVFITILSLQINVGRAFTVCVTAFTVVWQMASE